MISKWTWERHEKWMIVDWYGRFIALSSDERVSNNKQMFFFVCVCVLDISIDYNATIIRLVLLELCNKSENGLFSSPLNNWKEETEREKNRKLLLHHYCMFHGHSQSYGTECVWLWLRECLDQEKMIHFELIKLVQFKDGKIFNRYEEVRR